MPFLKEKVWSNNSLVPTLSGIDALVWAILDPSLIVKRPVGTSPRYPHSDITKIYIVKKSNFIPWSYLSLFRSVFVFELIIELTFSSVFWLVLWYPSQATVENPEWEHEEVLVADWSGIEKDSDHVLSMLLISKRNLSNVKNCSVHTRNWLDNLLHYYKHTSSLRTYLADSINIITLYSTRILSDESQILNTHVLTKRFDKLFERRALPIEWVVGRKSSLYKALYI